MKFVSLLNVIVFNGVALILAALVYDDRVWRVNYFLSEGFTPTTRYYPLFYVTSAVRGTTTIPGLLALDWLQVILVVAIIVDGGFVLGLVRERRAPRSPSFSSPNP